MGKGSPEPVSEPSGIASSKAQRNKQGPSGAKTIASLRESPKRHSDLAHSAKRSPGKKGQDSLRVGTYKGKDNTMPQMARVEDIQGRRVSPYKLLMFGEKDMYYR